MAHPGDLAALRREYADRGLTPADLAQDPVEAVLVWLADAQRAGLHEPNAMVVSTVGRQGPSSRMVLLKGADADGFVFYTNYRSPKAVDLDGDARCALLFPWHPLERQVRVEGVAARVTSELSDAYFGGRPRGSQLGAWASPQSEVVPNRAFLDQRYAEVSDRFHGVDDVPRPSHWGGFVVRPTVIEFWQGRPGRMHDRVRFEQLHDGAWMSHRLAP